MSLSIADVASGKVSSLSLLDHPFCNQPLSQIFLDVLPGNWPLSELRMTTRSSNALLRSNVQTLGDLGQLSPKDIFDIRNTGFKTTKEILDVFISKLNVDYAEPDLPDFKLPKVGNEARVPIETHIWRVLEVLAMQIDRREAALISNALSVEKVRVSQISDTWGITRQRTYQIVDKLVEKFSSQDSLQEISKIIFAGSKVLTKAEAQVACPLLSLGASNHGVFLSVLDLLIYSKRVYFYQGLLLVDPTVLDLSSDDPIVKIHYILQNNPSQISPEVSKLFVELNQGIMEPVTGESTFESSISRATAWLDSQ